MNVSIKQLRAFVLGARYSSFSAAAEKMGMTQPGYSLLIRQLEKEFDLELFHRTTRRVTLTSVGQEMLEQALRTLNQLDEVIGHAEDLRSGQSGTLSLAVITSVACSLLPQALATFTQKHPKVRLKFQEEQAIPLLDLIGRGETEIGIGLLPTENEALNFEVLLKDELVVVLHQDHPLASHANVSWKSLNACKFISVSKTSGLRINTDRAAMSAGVEMTPAFETPTLTTAIGLIRAQLGCAVMPNLALASLNLDRIVVRPLEQRRAWREIGLLTRRNWSLSPAALAFAQIMRETVAQKQAHDLSAVQD